MSRSTTAAEAPPSDPADPSARLLHALLSSAGLSIRADAVSAPAPPAPKKRRPRRAPSSSR
jgi:hypothetical protein